jgi:[ribosomal protein S18]-alanine N-acetyltransferase
MQKAGYSIRPMNEEDISQVSEIDREAFPGESLFRPYASYRQEIHNSLAHYIVACIEGADGPDLSRRDVREMPWFRRFFSPHRAMALQGERYHLHSGEHIVGFSGLWTMLDEAHITAIAVRENYRRLGIGEGLLISIIELASCLNANIVTLEVRASNLVAQALYTKYGFRVVGSRPRYYSDNGEDATLMSTDTITSALFQARFQRLKRAHSEKCGVSATTRLA